MSATMVESATTTLRSSIRPLLLLLTAQLALLCAVAPAEATSTLLDPIGDTFLIGTRPRRELP